jgi:hypothetical protein
VRRREFITLLGGAAVAGRSRRVRSSAQVRRNLAYSGSAFAPESSLLVGEQSPEAAPVTCMKSNLTVQFLPLI